MRVNLFRSCVCGWSASSYRILRLSCSIKRHFFTKAKFLLACVAFLLCDLSLHVKYSNPVRASPKLYEEKKTKNKKHFHPFALSVQDPKWMVTDEPVCCDFSSDPARWLHESKKGVQANKVLGLSAFFNIEKSISPLKINYCLLGKLISSSTFFLLSKEIGYFLYNEFNYA